LLINVRCASLDDINEISNLINDTRALSRMRMRARARIFFSGFGFKFVRKREIKSRVPLNLVTGCRVSDLSLDSTFSALYVTSRFVCVNSAKNTNAGLSREVLSFYIFLSLRDYLRRVKTRVAELRDVLRDIRERERDRDIRVTETTLNLIVGMWPARKILNIAPIIYDVLFYIGPRLAFQAGLPPDNEIIQCYTSQFMSDIRNATKFYHLLQFFLKTEPLHGDNS